MGEISRLGEESVAVGGDIGHLITENQTLLTRLPGVPSRRTNMIVEICGRHGVPAKITGAGGGGVVIGVIREGVEVGVLENELTEAGFQVIRDIKTGVKGVHVVQGEEEK